MRTYPTYPKRKRSTALMTFMVSYALAFIVLAAAAFLAVAALAPQSKAEPVRELSAYLPEQTDERTLMLLFTDGSEPVGCTLLSLSAPRREIPVTTLPPQTELECGRKSLTVRELFCTGGVGRVEDACEQTFGITVDGYILFDPESLREAADIVGPVDLDMPFALEDPDGGPAAVAKGMQRINGRLLGEIVTFGEYPGRAEGRAALISELCTAYIRQYLPRAKGDVAERTFKAVAGCVKTDISFKEVREFADAMGFLAGELGEPGGGRRVYTIEPEGEISGNGERFRLFEESRRDIAALMLSGREKAGRTG